MSNQKGSFFGALALCLSVSSFVAAIALGQVVDLSGDPWNVDDLRPGMRGFGLTVFRGTTPERFDVEVIDVLHDFRPDMDLVLIRTEHPILEDAPTVGGMSGSPIFIEGRLVGAYAYGWPFGRHPVAGVTPASDMLRELHRAPRPDSFPGVRPLAEVEAEAAGARSGGRRTRATGRPRPRTSALSAPYLGLESRGAFAAAEEVAARMTPRATGSTHTLVPASCPLLVGGLEPEAVELLASQLAPLGLDVLQAGGGGRPLPPGSPTPQHVPGGAIGVTLARGDITSVVTGTVTWVDGDRLVAFGHPMIEAGETGLPTAVSRVLHVLASVQRSFKLSEPVAPLGTLIEDRQAAIVVDTSLVAPTFPVRLRLRGIPEDRRVEWNYEVASHRVLSPLLVVTTVASAVKSVAADNAFVSYDATSRVWIEGVSGPIEVVDHGFSATGVYAASTLARLRAFDLIEAAFANPFVLSRVTRVEIDLDLRFERHTAEIVDISVPTTEVDPGSRVNLRVVLRPFGAPEMVRIVPVDIPTSAAGQTLQIRIAPGSEVRPERPDPRALSDVIDAIQNRYSATSMVVSIHAGTARGLSMDGHVVRSLPRSALSALQADGASDRARPFVSELRQEVPTDFIIDGSARVDVSVRRVARAAAR